MGVYSLLEPPLCEGRRFLLAILSEPAGRARTPSRTTPPGKPVDGRVQTARPSAVTGKVRELHGIPQSGEVRLVYHRPFGR